MAEHMPTGPAEIGAEMDYPEHERTYSGFIAFAKIGVVNTLDVLLCLVLYAFGGGWGFTLGTILLLLTLAAAAIDLATMGVKASAAVFVLGVVLIILAVG